MHAHTHKIPLHTHKIIFTHTLTRIRTFSSLFLRPKTCKYFVRQYRYAANLLFVQNTKLIYEFKVSIFQLLQNDKKYRHIIRKQC